jgi:hypothetical protein
MPKKHLYLPKILTGANIDEPVSNALWEDKQKKIVLAISDGIEIDETAQTRGVSSIPDIYARPLTFLGALRSDKHPLRKRIVQEWRGLLSLLALYKVKSDLGNLTITPVLLNDEKFSVALKNLAPKSVKLQKNGPEYSWTDILLIKFGDIPLGAFSPATLVYTSADYNTTLKEATFSLKDDKGYLKPPGKSEGLDYVGEWLEWFIREFNQYASTSAGASGDHKYVGDINKLLDSWLVEIKQELGIENSTPIEVARVKVALEPEPLAKPASFLSNYAIYRALLTPLVKNEDATSAGNKSEYALRMARNRSKYKEVVVINERQLSLDKILWDDTKPSELGNISILVDKFFKAPSGSTINRINLENHKAIWIRPELFFLTNTLLKAKSGPILNGTEAFLNAGNPNYILPFKKEILQFFSPVNIQEILKPRFNETDGKVIFSFFLPLENNQQVEIKKTYRLKGADTTIGEGLIKETEVPVLEIFPNYLGDFWCQYFMLCSDTDAFMMEPLNLESKSTISRKEQKFETNNSSNKAEIVRISGYNSFPEGIEIKPKTGQEENFGIILLNKNRDIESKPFNGSASVGIDFGTSNTNIFKYSNGNAVRWTFSFSKYLRSLFNTPTKESENKRNESTRLFFVPTVDQELPIPTALRIFKAGVTSNMLLDHFIYFPDQSRYPDNVYTDIKWDDDDTKLNSFLKSLIFLLMVDLVQERVSRIEFRCSYPKSFTDDRIRAYKRGWTETLEGFFHKSDKEEEVGPEQFIYVDNRKFDEDKEAGVYNITTRNNGKLIISVKPKFTTEGIAAGEYFSSEYIITDGISHANKEDGSVCIDVGGGTSDYSIWFGSKIRLDASVLLAGKQIAKLLKNNSRVRETLLSEDGAAALNEVKTNDILFSSRLNFVLRKEEKSIAVKLSNNANNKDIAWLRRILAIEFGALSFYAAHLCLALDEFLIKELSKRVKENGIKLHWGGNAAKFINWIDYGRYERDGIASKFLNGMFGNTILDKSIGDRAFRPALLGQVQSPGHKDEASGGIVVMNFSEEAPKEPTSDGWEVIDTEEGNREVLNGLIVGDQITVNGKVLEHYEVINKDTFFNDNLSNFTGTELKQLDRFIFLINQVGKMTGLFPEGSQINLSLEEKLAIKQRVKNDIASLARLKPDARIIEPVFIMEVKYLLDILSNKMK